MKDYKYSSEICLYCAHTDYGCAPVNTGLHNICYGDGCEEAYSKWQEENPDDNREMEELFE